MKIIILILCVMTTPLMAMEGSVRPKPQPIKHEPIVRVERYVAPDYKNDPEVLIAYSKPPVQVKETEKTVVIYKDRLVVDKPVEEVKIIATWESD